VPRGVGGEQIGAVADEAGQHERPDRLALAILEGRFVPGDAVRVDADGGELVLERAEVAAAA
jgi:hypothetical protein